jgi:hypothetical protein
MPQSWAGQSGRQAYAQDKQKQTRLHLWQAQRGSWDSMSQLVELHRKFAHVRLPLFLLGVTQRI